LTAYGQPQSQGRPHTRQPFPFVLEPNMALTEEQRQRVWWLLEGHLDEHLEDAEFTEKFNRLFAAMTSPEELFLFAHHSSGDLEPNEWRRVIDNPLCDQGTALLVFWRHSPGWYYRWSSREQVPPRDLERYDLLKSIELRYLSSSFPSARIRFDPRSFRGHDLVASNEWRAGGTHVPSAMCQPSPGEPVPLLW